MDTTHIPEAYSSYFCCSIADYLPLWGSLVSCACVINLLWSRWLIRSIPISLYQLCSPPASQLASPTFALCDSKKVRNCLIVFYKRCATCFDSSCGMIMIRRQWQSNFLCWIEPSVCTYSPLQQTAALEAWEPRWQGKTQGIIIPQASDILKR